MDILATATQMLTQHLGTQISEGNASQALTNLLGGDNGNIDIAALIAKFTQQGDLSGVVSSWLADGANQDIAPSQLLTAFGKDKIAAFAGDLGVDESSASSSLSAVLPNLIDQNSAGGSLLDNLGGAGGMLNMAKSLF